MKRALSALCLGILAAYLLFPSAAITQQRGDLYGARSLLALEQAFKTTGVLTFPNYAAAPVVCNAANRGVYYYDTVLLNAYVCGNAGWLAVGGGGLTVGTAGVLPMWNAVPDDLVDSSLSDNGTDVLASGGLFTSGTAVGAANSVLLDGNNSAVAFEGATVDGFEGYLQAGDFLGGADLTVTLGNPAAGAGGNLVEIATTVAAMNNDDTLRALSIMLVDADHTGANNFQIGVDVWGIIGDDQARSSAFRGGVGWDSILWANTAVLTMGSDLDYITFYDQTLTGVFAFDLEHDPTANHTWQWIIAPSDIMTGGGFVERGLWVDITNADHTNVGGLGNTVYGIDVDGITGDAQATEVATHIGAGWDYDIEFADTSPTIRMAGNATLALRENNIDYYSFVGNAAADTAFHRFTSGNSGWFTGRDFVSLTATTTAMNGSDTMAMLNLAATNADHTGAGNTLNLLEIGAIAGDANANLNAILIGALTGTTGAAGELEYAINVQAGWDAAFHHVGIAHANLVAAANGSIVFCTDCDPATTPCTAVGAQTGAFAFRVNGQWDCPW